MALRFVDLRWMVEESMTLSERFDPDVLPGGGGPHAAAGNRLQKWRNRVAGGEAARFDKRLRWDGLEVESALRLLGAVRWPRARPLPPWARFLAAAVSDTDADTGRVAGNFGEQHPPQPFEDLLLRFIPEATRRMQARLGTLRDRLSPAAVADLECGLLGRLCRIAARTLCAEFDVFRATHTACLFPGSGEPALRGRQAYLDFVRSFHGDAFAAWLLRYPLLARLLANCCQQWIAGTVELVRRLDRDASAIRTTFGLADGVLRICRVTPYLSDPHRGGRTVCRLQFESGIELVYKPRRLAIDRCFHDLLAEVASTSGIRVTRLARVLDCGDHGWVECVHASPCADRAAVEWWYRRAGMLACLVHVLGGNDLHAGNIIAAGKYPIPIDLECIVGAPLASAQPQRGSEPACGAVPGNLFRTGLLPIAQRGMDRVFRIDGGLAEPDPRPLPRQPTRHTNTDRMSWRRSHDSTTEVRNVPRLDDRAQTASDHVAPLLEGFRLLYDVLCRNRDRLVAAQALRRIEEEEFRVVIRNTRSYAALIEDALAPQHVTSGPDWSIALDIIAAPSLAAAERPACWPTRTAERIELERLDIPLFWGRANRPALQSAAGGRLEERLETAGWSASTRLARMHADDREQQATLLRMSLAIADSKRSYRGRRARAARRCGPKARPEFLVEVRAIVDLLERLAVDDGKSTTWLGPGGPSATAPVLEPVGISLFSGTSGIALLLATAAVAADCCAARVLANRVFGPLCRRLADGAGCDLAAEIGIGGGTGLGGLVYALTHAGRMLERPDCFSAARAAAGAITRTAIVEDEVLDVLSGAAGALLGLLVLYGALGDRRALLQAVHCGEHLLDCRTVDTDTGIRTWGAPDNFLGPGFAHGTSGIACALRRLTAVTGRSEFGRAAAEANTLERRQAKRTMQAQPAAETHDAGNGRRRSWCGGLAGIGLARLAAHDRIDAPALSAIETALGSFSAPVTDESDVLCCGRMGHADFLLTAGRRLDRPDLCAAATNLGRQIMGRALQEGHYAIDTDEGFRPGLFQGVSGIGYELLRMQAPDIAPSVLSWE